MKVIDLLNKVLKKEDIPSAIKYNNKIYVFKSDFYDYYCNDDNSYLFYKCVTSCTGEMMIDRLNDEVEIMGEDEEYANIDELSNLFTHEDTTAELSTRDWEKSVISKKINALIRNQKKLIAAVKVEESCNIDARDIL